MKKISIYLDDVRTPISDSWMLVRNYDEFVQAVTAAGLENIDMISLDHDLGDTAMEEYYHNVSPNYTLNYDNIKEKTGLDCAKWLIDFYYSLEDSRDRSAKRKEGIIFPKVYTHSANPIGSANIMGYINNFLMNEAQSQSCVRVRIDHTIVNN
jgi:hypothetical protein